MISAKSMALCEAEMGGYGSGTWQRTGTRCTVEACLELDITRWQHAGLLQAGTAFTWAWWDDADDARDGDAVPTAQRATMPPATIRVVVHAAAVELAYQVHWAGHGSSNEGAVVHYAVALTGTACHYGGQRRWFVCPGVVDGQVCARRVGRLYLPPEERYFLCRHCYGLSYASQRRSAADRAEVQAQAIRRRLGGPGRLAEPFPARPPRMHRRTYARLRAQAVQADTRAWQLAESRGAGVQARTTQWLTQVRDEFSSLPTGDLLPWPTVGGLVVPPVPAPGPDAPA
jgi:hypothetical protein